MYANGERKRAGVCRGGPGQELVNTVDLGGPSLNQGLLGAPAVKRRGLNDLLTASLGHCGYNRTIMQEEWDRKSFSLKINAINCLWSFSLIQLIF